MQRFLGFLIFSLNILTPIQAQINAQSGGTVSCQPLASTNPVWGKLILSGNMVTCFYATGETTPTTWKQVGYPITLGFINNPLLVGLYITAHDRAVLSTGTIDNLSITPKPIYRLVDCDIGGPPLMGSANLISGVWNLTGSGADIWGTADQFNFQPWLVWGDCTIICRVTSLSNGSPWQKIGIMIRDGYNSGADYASFCATRSSGVAFQYRIGFNNNPDITRYVAPPSPGVTSSVVIGYGLSGSLAYVVRP